MFKSKKLIVAMLLTGLVSSLSASISTKKFYEEPNTSTISFKDSKGYTFIYNRKDVSVQNNSEAQLLESLYKNVCGNPKIRNFIESGIRAKYIYLLKDGSYLEEISSCKNH